MKAKIALIAMFLLTIAAGAYAQSFGANEIVHFWLAVPAGVVSEPTTLRGAGPPISLSPLRIDLTQRGFFKNLFQPNVEALSTHWIYNLGTKPVKIRMELVNVTIPVKWEVNANFDYDPETHTFTQPLMPGSSIPNLGIDWIFHIPENDAPLVYNGGLLLIDADTGMNLTVIPIKIGRGEGSFGGASCCG